MRKLAKISFVALIACGVMIPLVFAQPWNIWNPTPPPGYWLTASGSGGTYTVTNETLSLFSTGSGSWIELYEVLNQTSNFTISYDLYSPQLPAFCVKLADGTPPFFGSTDNIAFDFQTPVGGQKGFEIARWNQAGWSWGAFAAPSIDTWYNLTIEVHQAPFEVVYTVYQAGELIGRARASDMTNLGFSDLHWIVLECWAEAGQVDVANFVIS